MRNNIISLRYFNIACRCILNCGELKLFPILPFAVLHSPLSIPVSRLLVLHSRFSFRLLILIHSHPHPGWPHFNIFDFAWLFCLFGCLFCAGCLPLLLSPSHSFQSSSLPLPFNNTFVHRKIIAAGHVIFWMACNLVASDSHGSQQKKAKIYKKKMSGS